MQGFQEREIKKARLIEHVSYELRGPIADKAAKMNAEGIPILALNTGNPPAFGFESPDFIIEALVEGIRNSEGYSASRGTNEAVEAIRDYFATEKGIKGLGFDDIYTGNGVSEMISVSLQALLNPGDEILIPMPDYPLWTSAAILSGGKVVHYLCDEQADWIPDMDDIRRKITSKTRAIVIINPNNPTGALYPKDALAEICEIARQNDLIIFSDEIYDRLVMDGAEHISTATLAPDLLTVTYNGLSKSHMVPGFRCGWMAFSGDKKRARSYMEGVHILSSMRLCANVPAQSIIRAGLANPYSAAPLLEPGGRLYEQRELIHGMVNDIPGLSAVKPKAAFYMFPKIDAKRFNIRSDGQFILDFLNEQHILMTQGKGFNWPEPDHFRIVYLPEVRELERMGQSLKAFLATYRQQ